MICCLSTIYFVKRGMNFTQPAQPSESQAFNERRGMWIDYVSERTEMHPTVRLIGIWLARRINWRTDDTWYQVSTIAIRVGQSPRTVIRAIQELEKAGLLLVRRDGRRGTRTAVNRYALLFPIGPKVTWVSPCQSDMGVTLI